MPKFSPRARRELIDALVGIMEQRADKEADRVAMIAPPRSRRTRPGTRASSAKAAVSGAGAQRPPAAAAPSGRVENEQKRHEKRKPVKSHADVLFGESKKVER
jgi:hypothetical protein